MLVMRSITWINRGRYQITVFDLVLEDLAEKPVFILGGRGSGKTVMAKRIVELTRRRYKMSDVRCYDPSTAWWHSAPFKFKMNVTPGNYRSQSDTLYEVGRLSRDERRDLLMNVIRNEYDKRYLQALIDPDYLSKSHLSVMGLEEAQSLLAKSASLPTQIHDWIGMGRNLNMTGILCTQRPAEIKTEIIERCNLLVGYIEGDRNRQKIRGATSDDFMRGLRKLGKYEFGYYNGDKFRMVKVREPKHYKSPTLISSR